MVRGRKNPLHFGIGKRLRALRRQHNIGGKPLSIAANLAGTTVLRIESDATVPSIGVVEKLAFVLKVSAGYLAYGVESLTPASSMPGSTAIAGRLRMSRSDNGLSLNALAKLSGVARTTIGYIESGSTIPSVATVELLAAALDVPAPWLAFGEGHAQMADSVLNDSAIGPGV